MGGVVSTSHVVHGEFEVGEAVTGDRAVFIHIGLGHMGGVIVGVDGGEGTFRRSVRRGGGVRWESEATYGVHDVLESRLSEGILSYCKGNCGPERIRRRDAEVLAGDPKFSLLSNSKLNNKHTWQGIQRGKDKDPPAGMP